MKRKHFDYPVYYHIEDDGAPIRCIDCQTYLPVKDLILCQIPKDDSRKLLCFDCVDEDWLKSAKDLGVLKD